MEQIQVLLQIKLFKSTLNMTRIIRIIMIVVLYLHCEKNCIPISAIYVTKTGTSGDRLCR